ncbi:MAG TPA: hypothetical protein VER12_06570 [Polyangiaceae bacterium]|nr:hypothetical protein [Polyangiaceae bacterium]HYQ26752.1 hypothetical protein [Polyangiaceae bacterium]
MQNRKRCGELGAVLTVLAMGGVALPGCTFVGGGVGSVVDSMTPGPYEERPPSQLLQLERDERVLILLRNGTRVAGLYRGTHGPTAADLERYLMVSADDDSLIGVKLSDVSSIAVEVTGKGWLYGGLAGLAVDTTVVVVSVIALHHMQMKPLGEGCFC